LMESLPVLLKPNIFVLSEFVPSSLALPDASRNLPLSTKTVTLLWVVLVRVTVAE
jgi:hypothetical protein